MDYSESDGSSCYTVSENQCLEDVILGNLFVSIWTKPSSTSKGLLFLDRCYVVGRTKREGMRFLFYGSRTK